MVPDIVRDSFFGHAIRLASRNKLFQYPEERDHSIAERYYHNEKTRYLTRFGQTSVPDDSSSHDSDRQDEKSEKDIENDKSQSPTPHRVDSDTTLTGGDGKSAADSKDHNAKNIFKHPVDSEKGRDQTVVDWDGEQDPENPQNWSLRKKFFVTFQICLLTTGVYIGSAIYTPGIEQIIQIYGVSQVAATLGLSLFVAGYGLGPMIWSPMSEVPQVGRMPIYILTLFVFVLFQIPTALPANFGMFLAFRFLTGFFGSPVLATGGATLADIYAPRKRAYAISIWGLSAIAGPSLGMYRFSLCSSDADFPRSTGRRLCGNVQTLELDDLGDYVDLGFRSGFPLLSPAGNLLVKHLVPQDESIAKTHK